MKILERNLILKINNQRGLSLISVLVGVAIIGILGIVVLELTSNSINSAKLIAKEGQEEDMRRLVVSRVNCNKTLEAARASRNAGTPMRLLNRHGSDFLPNPNNNVYKSGKWNVRATGHDPNTGVLDIKIRHADDSEEKNLFERTAPLVCL